VNSNCANFCSNCSAEDWRNAAASLAEIISFCCKSEMSALVGELLGCCRANAEPAIHTSRKSTRVQARCMIDDLLFEELWPEETVAVRKRQPQLITGCTRVLSSWYGCGDFALASAKQKKPPRSSMAVRRLSLRMFFGALRLSVIQLSH